MFGIGFPEMILILALALIVVGPDKLPDLARSIAKTIMDLKKTAEGLKDNLNIEDNPLSEIKPELENAAKNFKETILDAETHTWKETSKQLPEHLDDKEKSLLDSTVIDQPDEGQVDQQGDTSPPQPLGEIQQKNPDDDKKND